MSKFRRSKTDRSVAYFLLAAICCAAAIVVTFALLPYPESMPLGLKQVAAPSKQPRSPTPPESLAQAATRELDVNSQIVQLDAVEDPAATVSPVGDPQLSDEPLPASNPFTLAGGESSGDKRPALDLDSRGSTNEHYRLAGSRLTIDSGRVMNVGAIFAREKEALEDQLQAAYRRGTFLRINHEASSEPFLLISRVNATLQGPVASFYPDGSPTCYLDYKRGKRGTALLTWDETKRPLVFEQYDGGKKNGLRCLFKACSENCPEGHIWLVQEWRKGVLQAAHLVPEDGKTHTFEYVRGEVVPRDDSSFHELELAEAKLNEFEEKVAANEQELFKAVAQYSHQEQLAIAAMRQAAAVRYREQLLASMSLSMSGRYGMPSMPVTYCRGGG